MIPININTPNNAIIFIGVPVIDKPITTPTTAKGNENTTEKPNFTGKAMGRIPIFFTFQSMPKLNSNGKFVATEGYPMLITFLGYDIEVGEEVWDGTTSEPTQTDEDGNILISTAEELAHIVSTGGAAGANYKLNSDIYLNATDYINWETGEVTLGHTPNSWHYNTLFQGNIDGNGYTVYGLYYNVPGVTSWGYQGVGLIPHVNSGVSVTVKNLAIDKAYISSVNGASAFVGFVGPTYHNEAAEEATTEANGASYELEDGIVYNICQSPVFTEEEMMYGAEYVIAAAVYHPSEKRNGSVSAFI